MNDGQNQSQRNNPKNEEQKKVRKWTWATSREWCTAIPHAAAGRRVPSAIFIWQSLKVGAQ